MATELKGVIDFDSYKFEFEKAKKTTIAVANRKYYQRKKELLLDYLNNLKK